MTRQPVVALLGPRQSGKTTIARGFVAPRSPNYFDLEDPVSLARLDAPMTALGGLRSTVVIDEIQRQPDLFPALRVLADRRPRRARFLLLGSASPDLVKQTSETLAGRLEIVEMGGLRLQEAGGITRLDRHWLRGGFPRSFLARSEEGSRLWRREFVRSIVERDLPMLGVRGTPVVLSRFWAILAHCHGNIWNAAEPARTLGLSQPTVASYLDLLTGLFLVRQLAPWHENLLTRQVKSPKVYIRDTGLLHQLLGIRNRDELLVSPRLGASWEGYAIEETLKVVQPDQAWFWATHAGAELDLLMLLRGRKLGVEVKREDAPRLTTSMRRSMEALELSHLTVLYPGTQSYRLAESVNVMPLAELSAGDPSMFMR
ncbi:MAG: ATP-binding protein [Gemmatimonadota bacterium]